VQLQQLNLARAWERVDAPVLLVHGEYDWVMSGSDFALLAAALNARKPGSAEFVEWPRADHSLYTHGDERTAFHRDPQQKYDPALTERVLQWLRARQ
jgi:pimeloyl-ACP methyl ester carboxylesterase